MRISVDIDRNTDTDILFQFKDEAGEVIKLNDYALKMQVRPKPQSSKLFDELSTENGRVVFDGDFVKAVITATASMDYDADVCYFDMLATDKDGRKTRVVEGVINVSAEVTL